MQGKCSPCKPCSYPFGAKCYPLNSIQTKHKTLEIHLFAQRFSTKCHVCAPFGTCEGGWMLIYTRVKNSWFKWPELRYFNDFKRYAKYWNQNTVFIYNSNLYTCAMQCAEPYITNWFLNSFWWYNITCDINQLYFMRRGGNSPNSNMNLLLFSIRT